MLNLFEPTHHSDFALAASVMSASLGIGIEIGPGLGVPSILASNLGAKVKATDGDDGALQLSGTNEKRNALSCHVKPAVW